MWFLDSGFFSQNWYGFGDSDYGFFKKTVKDAKISKKSSTARKQSCFIAYELNTLHKDIRIVNVEVPTKL